MRRCKQLISIALFLYGVWVLLPLLQDVYILLTDFPFVAEVFHSMQDMPSQAYLQIIPPLVASLLLRICGVCCGVCCIIASQVYRRPWKFFLWTGLMGLCERLYLVASNVYSAWYRATQVVLNPPLEALVALSGVDASFYFWQVLHLLPPLALVLLALYDRKRPDAPVYEPLPLPVFFRNLVPWTKSAVRRVAAFIREHKIL